MELWRHVFAFCGQVAPLARRSEEAGYDGLMVADSQNLNAGVWVEPALAGAATKRILLGPGVTNPATRRSPPRQRRRSRPSRVAGRAGHRPG
jgi:alkanesulfonate monooxygenase SsuD/methylene tetrahydromethanopterin reductase-like flavin-dependent oxidoreductase (luciferase family)